MAWIKLETSVSRHRKFLAAGPAASWLWVCGLAYCQEGLTDGFIPFQAVKHLGVRGPNSLITKLVRAGLWEQCEGGWRVHDYLSHHKPASEVLGLKQERRVNGAKGGVVSGEKRRYTDQIPPVAKQSAEANAKQVASTDAKQTANPVQISTATRSETDTDTEPLDVALQRFQRAYPASRRKGGRLIEEAFMSAVHKAGSVAPLMAALSNHVASEQWSNPKLIPGMDTWLTEERWRQMLPPAGAVAASMANTKTAGNVPAFKRFIERHGRAVNE